MGIDERLAGVERRLRMAKADLRRDLARRAPAPATAEEQLGLAFKPGDVVVDLVTGQEVVIRGGTKTENLNPAPGR